MGPDPEQFDRSSPASDPGEARQCSDASPACGEKAETATHEPAAAAAAPAERSVRYPAAYTWFVFLAALDVMLTYLILHPVLFFRTPDMTESRGTEVNALANYIIQRWDVPGMVLFKFVLVVGVVVICEIIGRRKAEAGRRLAEWSVAITVIPVVVALIQMIFDLYYWVHPQP